MTALTSGAAQPSQRTSQVPADPGIQPGHQERAGGYWLSSRPRYPPPDGATPGTLPTSGDGGLHGRRLSGRDRLRATVTRRSNRRGSGARGRCSSCPPPKDPERHPAPLRGCVECRKPGATAVAHDIDVKAILKAHWGTRLSRRLRSWVAPRRKVST